ncbi:MAG: Aldehyde dehydrogenase [Myxococcaceae bacterium]|nr:Aldehyde dehydrogenase [Myxococcaceae bacterium]
MTTDVSLDPTDLSGEPDPARLRALFDPMHRASRHGTTRTYEQRIGDLDRLSAAMLRRQDDIARAISEDFGHRSRHETLIAEVFVTLQSIDHTREHLAAWMSPAARPVRWLFQPGRAEIVPQPLGVVGIIGPWNYPFQLLGAPLVYALAAGNRVMLKPSEFVPRISALIADIVRECFAPEQVCLVQGGPKLAEAFSQLPFDLLFFTGSTRVGKHVMRAAAENLTPVVLELGGKSPAVVTPGASLSRAATSIVTGKLFNAGQTCIAPDYALVQRGERDAFVAELVAAAARLYPTLLDNPDYSSIVNAHHRARLVGLLDDARAKGATLTSLAPAAEFFGASGKLAPALLLDVDDEMAVMQEEIFGPLLPVVTYDTLDDAIAYVNDRPRPLALYPFGDDRAAVQAVIERTVSGGVAVNETMVHFAQEDLPFGGVGPSGMGHYHGREGFEAMSKMKPVFHQARVNGTFLLRPPYGPLLDTALRALIPKG